MTSVDITCAGNCEITTLPVINPDTTLPMIDDQ